MHHITYERVGREYFEDLMVVCSGCHDLIEAFIKRMMAAGRNRKRVMKRIAPYAIRRLLMVHDLWRREP